MMQLEAVRTKIDAIDLKILRLLHQRMTQGIMAGRLKHRIEDGRREKAVLAGVKEHARGLLDPDLLERVFCSVIEESKRLQAMGLGLTAFQGEPGAFSEAAARAWDGTLVPIPCREFGEVFDGVEEGLFDQGMVPVENTLGGIVGEVNERLTRTKLKISGALELPVHHCLLAPPGTRKKDVRAVFSHPQALAQCRRYLLKNGLDPVPYYDTAGAARMVADEKAKGTAALADRLCAEWYGLEILDENVEDLRENRTRFLVLSREGTPEGGEKCSVLFSMEHKAGALLNAMALFAREQLNLTRITSVPGRPGSYSFFVDFLGSDRDPGVIRVLRELRDLTQRFRLLGCYNERRMI